MPSDLAWPDTAICHAPYPETKGMGTDGIFRWKQHGSLNLSDDERPYLGDFKVCEWCGSISTEDMYRLVVDEPHARLTIGDMDSGWPDRVHVIGIPNLNAGKMITTYVYGEPENLVHDILPGRSIEEYQPNLYRVAVAENVASARFGSMWFSVHLYDLEDGTFTAVSDLLQEHLNIKFYWKATEDDASLMWQIER